MKIDLHNFFKHYDEKNPKHVAAVEQLEVDLSKIDEKILDDSANWVRIYRTPVNAGQQQSGNIQSVVLNVPYYPQTDNYTQPNRTCNSSSCAMCLEYFKPGTLSGAKGDDAYIKKVFEFGDTTDHSVQTKALESYGIKSSFSYHLTFEDLDEELNAGRPVVIGIFHRGPLSAPTGGHMVVVIGRNSAGDYIVNDPYGSLNDGYTGSVYNGKGAVYKRSELKIRWCPNGNDGWGRIFYATPHNSAWSKLVNQVKVASSGDLPKPGVELIKKYEGCRLNAYPDPLTGNLPITIGWGSIKNIDGKPFKLGDKITQDYADELLYSQLRKEYLPGVSKIPYWNEMTEYQKGALLSFAYNLGAGFYGSAGFNTITRVLRDKEWDKVPDALYLYRNPGTNVEEGLARRRKEEGEIWKKS